MSRFKLAFTMVEIVFTIVVLGILAGLAVPRMMATRDDAQIMKIRSEIAAIRQAIQSSCIDDIPENSGKFDINISVQYIGLSAGNANNECTPAQNYINNSDVDDPNSKGSILLDVIVSADKNLTTEPIRYHRRTLQKL